MGKSLQYNRICQVLFWIKFTVALTLSIGGLVLLGWLVKEEWHKGQEKAKFFATQNQGITIDNSTGSVNRCWYRPTGSNALARVEPPSGSLLVGFHLNWNIQEPIDVVQLLSGTRPSVYNAFVQYSHTANPPVDYKMIEWHFQEVGRAGGILELTMEPDDIDNIPESQLQTFANRIREFNSKYGVLVLLRWGHEMNGDWTSYGYQPTAYTSGFRKMARIMHATSNMTAMVWSPNIGITYPFSGGGRALPAPGTPDFRLMDSNNDGRIDTFDDPYLPFYPGDEYVDWVGISLYYYPDTVATYNTVPPAGYFRDFMTGSGPNMDTINPQAPFQGLRNFYQRFAVDRNKPMMIPETGAPWFPTQPPRAGISELAIKQAWWRQVYDTVKTQFPRIKVIVNFEETKRDAGALLRDWQVVTPNKTDILNAFAADLRARSADFKFAPQLKYACDGSVTTV